MDSESTPSRASSPASSEVTPQIRVGNFVKLGTFHVERSKIDEIYYDRKFHGSYNDFFINKLNKDFADLSCVLISNGPRTIRKHGLWTLRYICKHSECKRFYKVFQVSLTQFTVFRNNEEMKHDIENPICRPVKGQRRSEATDKMKHMFPENYLQECENEADKTLLAEGNLQGVISMETAKKIRHEAMSAKDFDKDAIIDLLLMKLSESENNFKKGGETNNEADKEVIYLRRNLFRSVRTHDVHR